MRQRHRLLKITVSMVSSLATLGGCKGQADVFGVDSLLLVVIETKFSSGRRLHHSTVKI